MKEHPIIFSTPMVQAILEGRKTMTRRVVKPKHDWYMDDGMLWPMYQDYVFADDVTVECPYGQPGDRLWVREAFVGDTAHYVYKADDNTELFKIIGDLIWKSPMFMPKSAARLWLEITNIRVERLQDITYADGIIQEGYPNEHPGCSPIQWFENIWTKINGHESWAANPWVWVIEFRRVK